ncbi:MAG: ADP-ribosylglycohydrolase family protein, partial [Caldilineaceae bacterium]|nr:ADP-ribosylglycohydrolase family protein [Caldilineaceae bacterium]
APIADVGVEVRSATRADGVIYLDYLTWSGTPNVTLRRPDYDTGYRRFGGAATSDMWRLAWVNGVDQYDWWWPEAYRIVQNEGRGLLMQGSREWTDYQVSATVVPHLAAAAGIAVRVQGMKRYYALLLCADQKLRLIKALDGDRVLAEIDFAWQLGGAYALNLAVEGNTIRGAVDGKQLLTAQDNERVLEGGGVALVIEEGRLACEAVAVGPLNG